ncbi:MAG: glutathione S-transferase family protein, partial [Burkholderiales bacterium]
MTLKLCGFSASNYYNKLKLQLLEKGVAFEEELVWTGNTHPKLVDRSPMGKVPFLETPHGCVSESMACAEYIEQQYTSHPLLPADPFAAAKVRELIVYLELHIELVVRELYGQAFFGGQASDET